MDVHIIWDIRLNVAVSLGFGGGSEVLHVILRLYIGSDSASRSCC